MKLKLDNLKKYNKFTNFIVSPENQFYKSVYFDFETKNAYFLSENYQARLKFDYEGDSTNNFFLDAVLLNNLINMTPELDVEVESNDEGITDIAFKIGKDTFRIPYFEDEFPLKDFEGIDNKLNIPIKTDFLNLLKKVNNIIPLSDERKKGLWGVFIKNSKLVVTDALRFVDIKVNNIDDVNISHDLLSFIYLCSGNEKVDIYDNNNSYKFIVDDTLEVIIAKTIDLELPVDINSEEFKKNFISDTTLKVNKKDIKDAVDVLKNFSSASSKDEIFIKIHKDTISLVIDDSIQKIYSDKDVKAEEISEELIDIEVKTKFSFLSDLLNMLNTDTYILEINPKAPAFNVVDANDTINHIVMIKAVG